MKIDEILSEASGVRGYGWSLLPATQALWSKNKVTLKEVGEQWAKCTVYVADNKGTPKFLCSSGGGFADVAVGSSKEGYHDQTFRQMGTFKILNIVELKDGKIVKQENDKHVEDKLAVLVFK